MFSAVESLGRTMVEWATIKKGPSNGQIAKQNHGGKRLTSTTQSLLNDNWDGRSSPDPLSEEHATNQNKKKVSLTGPSHDNIQSIGFDSDLKAKATEVNSPHIGARSSTTGEFKQTSSREPTNLRLLRQCHKESPSHTANSGWPTPSAYGQADIHELRRELQQVTTELTYWKQVSGEDKLRIENLNGNLTKLKKDGMESARQLHNLRIRYDSEVESSTNLQTQLREAHQQNQLFQQSLEECKSRIFQMQPFQGPTDQTIAEMYADLCRSIDTFVHTGFSGNDFDIMQLKAVDPSWQVIGLEHFSSAERVAIASNAAVAHAMLTSLVMRGLIFSCMDHKTVHPGIADVLNRQLGRVITAIGELMPPKDSEACREWKIDLYRALDIIPGVQNVTASGLRNTCEMLSNTAAIVGRSEQADDDFRKNCESIVQDAASLAHHIRLSTNEYIFQEVFAPDDSSIERSMFVKDLKHMFVIDSKTGLTLGNASVPIADPNGKIGEKICNVFPTLFRQATAETTPELLHKGTVIVVFDQEVPVVRKRKPRPVVE